MKVIIIYEKNYCNKFQNYEDATRDKAIGLVKICKEVSKIYNVKIFVVPQFTDIKKLLN